MSFKGTELLVDWELTQHESACKMLRDGVRPWEEIPDQLISWLDMEIFSVAKFAVISAVLGRLESWDEKQPLRGDWDKALELLESELRNVGLRVSASLVVRMKNNIENNVPKDIKTFTMQAAELQRRIEDEMKLEFFLHVPKKHAEYYSLAENVLGKDVVTKWPRMAEDAAECAKCYALSRFTASVFHLMRIMESSVQEFGAKLGITLVNEKNWQNILNEINKAIKLLDSKKDPLVKEYASVSANLYTVKLAWRNEVMHPKETYTEEEAGDILHAVRAFLRELIKVA